MGELIARNSITTSVITPKIASTMTCPQCGTFAKSGRASCCAPGGAWYKNCGGVSNRNAHHRWFEGVETCKLKMVAMSSVCPKCGIIAKSGKTSCCGHSGSWFGNCGSVDNVKLDHTWYEGIQACNTWVQS